MAWILEVAGEVITTGDGFIIESLPALAFVRCRARAQRCRKVHGRACCGSCAAERETFVGWRLHLVCRPDGGPRRVPTLPAGVHDLTTSPNSPRGVQGRTENMCDAYFQQHQNATAGRFGTRLCQCSA
jgi:transposase, IS4 family